MPCYIVLALRLRTSQVLNQVSATWKSLKHPNIVPLLGVTIDPLEIVSDWMPGEDILGYIANHPDADRLFLVGISYTAFATKH